MTENQICFTFGAVTGALLTLVVTGIVTLEMLIIIYAVGVIGFGFIAPIVAAKFENWRSDRK